MDTQTVTSTGCCPPFDPALWEGKTSVWKDKLFMQDTVRTLFHIPLNISRVITRMWKQVQDAQAATPTDELVMLFYDPSPWKSELSINVTKDVPGAKMTRISGTFLSKVFDGPYKDAPKWIQQMNQYTAAQGKKAIKHYLYYTTCPKCAKKYGHNYTVAFAQIE